MNRIEHYRKQKKLTILDLAINSNLSVGYICHLEKGTRNNPSYKTMTKIAIALDKSIEDIFYSRVLRIN
jgi:transcriptional regulator with XRE-family HTH domain